MALRRRLGGPMTPDRAKRMVKIATAIAPLLAPYAIAAAGAARHRWDAARAFQLGVTPAQLARFSGPGGGMHARISGLATALAELRTSAGGEAAGTQAVEFAERTEPRLAELAAAVRAAEQMPGRRRKVVHRAVSAELDGIDHQLLEHLGVSG
jgi:Family of unknown function (DUF6474)